LGWWMKEAGARNAEAELRGSLELSSTHLYNQRASNDDNERTAHFWDHARQAPLITINSLSTFIGKVCENWRLQKPSKRDSTAEHQQYTSSATRQSTGLSYARMGVYFRLRVQTRRNQSPIDNRTAGEQYPATPSGWTNPTTLKSGYERSYRRIAHHLLLWWLGALTVSHGSRVLPTHPTGTASSHK
jgi:hypothetical protein